MQTFSLICFSIFFPGRASVRNNGSHRGTSGWPRAPIAVRSSFGKNAGKAVKLVVWLCLVICFSEENKPVVANAALQI